MTDRRAEASRAITAEDLRRLLTGDDVMMDDGQCARLRLMVLRAGIDALVDKIGDAK